MKIVQNSNDTCHSPYVEVHGITRPHNWDNDPVGVGSAENKENEY